MDKKVLKAAASNIRKELRSHGGKKLLPEEKPVEEKPAAAVEEIDVEPENEKELPKKKGC